MPGSKMLKRPARRRRDSSGTAPSAPGEAEARSYPPSSPTHSRSYGARSPSGERSPLRNVSTNLEGELSAIGLPSPRASGNMHGAFLSHTSQADASNASGCASSRRSGEASPQRSIRDSGGVPSRPQSAHMLPSLPPTSAGPVQVATGHTPIVPQYVAQPPAPPQALYAAEAPEIVEMIAIPPPTDPAPAMRWQQSTEPQDPFLDDSPLMEVFDESTSVLESAPQPPSLSGLGATRGENGPGSITLQLPSLHNSKSIRLQTNSPMHRGAGSISFRQGLGGSGQGSFHSDVTTSGVVPQTSHALERRQSDPFLAEPAAIEEEGMEGMERGPSWEVSASLPEQVDSANTSAQLNSLDGSVGGGTAMLGTGKFITPLQRVSEASEVHEGMPAGLGAAAAGASNQSIVSGDSRDRLRPRRLSNASHDSEHSDPHSDPFLQETQNEQ